MQCETSEMHGKYLKGPRLLLSVPLAPVKHDFGFLPVQYVLEPCYRLWKDESAAAFYPKAAVRIRFPHD